MSFKIFKIFVYLIVMFISIYAIFNNLNREKDELLLSYINNIEENIVFNENKSVDIVFDYNFISNKKYDISYEYKIYTEFIIIIDNEELIEDYEVYENEMITKDNSNGYKLKEKITLDLDYFKNLLNNYVDAQGFLNIYFTTSNLGTYKEEEISVLNNSNIKISLNNMLITSENSNNDGDISTLIVYNNYNKVIIGLGLIIISLLAILFEYKSIKKIHLQQIKYNNYINEISSKFNIKKVNRTFSYKSKKKINVDSIEDMHRFSEKYNKEIVMFEKYKYYETWFMIVNNKEVYIYKFKCKNM